MSLEVAVLGATGTVGQKVIAMLENDPRFEVVEVAASARSKGKLYKDAMNWREALCRLPEKISNMTVKECSEVTAPYAVSALPADYAREVEPLLASRGTHVFSNASAMRMETNVPLLIPEVNGDHLSLIDTQTTSGKIVTNPNCSTVFATMGLKPLLQLGKVNHVSFVTLQAISGAGYPGISSMDVLGNIVPWIGGEEDKIVEETKKILGTTTTPANFSVTTHVHRVPVVHGHTIAMHVHFEDAVTADSVRDVFYETQKQLPHAYEIYTQNDRPQPLRDITANDQRAHIGRIKQGDAPNIIGLISQGHNLVRGAAGAALANMNAFLERQ